AFSKSTQGPARPGLTISSPHTISSHIFPLSSISGKDHDGVFLPLRRRRGQVGCAPVQVPDREPVPGDEVSRCRSSPPQVI
uniref:Uncharacterized protein n=1 Tax=Aegilops tauschii subsp. strangulata TaxID=200361 RepID=A0A453S137_AEGTS